MFKDIETRVASAWHYMAQHTTYEITLDSLKWLASLSPYHHKVVVSALWALEMGCKHLRLLLEKYDAWVDGRLHLPHYTSEVMH